MLIVRAVGPILVLAVAAGFYAWMARHIHFECPQCSAIFKVGNLALMFTIHIGLASFVVCPQCGCRAIMPPVRD